ncbi:MAG: hypothetical protein AAF636_18735 [Pseudomonadota bacterium]
MVVWRPERRNRNIGTKSSGYSKSNDMRIPESWLDKYGNCSLFWSRVELDYVQEVSIGNFRVKILYDKPHEGCSYGCSPADAVKLLNLVAGSVPAMPDIIAFRQPTRKQRQQSPVWGRFLYLAEFGKYEGTAIVLESQELGASLKRCKNMTLEDRAEYDRLRDDGHSFVETKRHYEAFLTEEGIRNTKLYRTLLHELGHFVEYYQKVLFKETALDPDQDVAEELYFSGPTSEREVFAHRFAGNISRSLIADGKIPFAPQPFP